MEKEFFWCNSHQRVATGITEHGYRYCEPAGGKNLLPCLVVDLTGQAYIEVADEGPFIECPERCMNFLAGEACIHMRPI